MQEYFEKTHLIYKFPVFGEFSKVIFIFTWTFLQKGTQDIASSYSDDLFFYQ